MDTSTGGNSLTAFLAVWGAIVSSITFGWTLYRDTRDRAKIILSAQIRRIGQRSDGAFFSIQPDLAVEGASEKLFIVVSVVNVGRRPIRWKGLGGKYKKSVNGKSGFLVSARYLPKMLEEQEAHDEFTDLDAQFIERNIKQFYIWDASGKEWHISSRDMKNLLQDAQKYGAPNAVGT
jgi:hypothetical protein